MRNDLVAGEQVLIDWNDSTRQHRLIEVWIDQLGQQCVRVGPSQEEIADGFEDDGNNWETLLVDTYNVRPL